MSDDYIFLISPSDTSLYTSRVEPVCICTMHLTEFLIKKIIIIVESGNTTSGVLLC